MGKSHVNARIDDNVLEALDAWAKDHGMTRTAAVERLVMDGIRANVDPPSVGPEQRQRVDEGTERAETHPEDLRAVIDVLRASNADLRAEVSRLWSQLATKDEQIRAAQNLADHAQQLHAAEVTRALPAEGEETRTLRQKLASIFGRKG